MDKPQLPQRVVVTDFDMGLFSIIRIAFKFAIAQVIVVWLVMAAGGVGFLVLAAMGAAAGGGR